MKFPVSKLPGGVLLDESIADILIEHGYVFCVDGSGNYARPTRRMFINGVDYGFEYLHRLVILLSGESIPDDLTVDHIDNITTDCRRDNLQLLTAAQNSSKKKLATMKYIAEMQGVYRVRISGVDIGTRKHINDAKRLRMIGLLTIGKQYLITPFIEDNPEGKTLAQLIMLDCILCNGSSVSLRNRLTKLNAVK